MTWAQGEERPRRLRFLNGTEAPVSVWLDNCLDHYRLGDVPPGKRWALELPDRLVSHAEQLHLHVYDLNGLVRVGSYAVDLEPKWTLSLDVGPGPGMGKEIGGEGDHGSERFEGLNGFLVIPGAGLTYAVRWAEDTPAALTWQCLEGEPGLTVSYAGGGEGKVPVEVSFQGGEEGTSGTWDVSRGETGKVVAPLVATVEIMEKALGAPSLSVRVGRGEEAKRHIFNLDGISEARRALRCFGREETKRDLP